MAEVGVLVVGGGLYLFSGVTMGLGCTTTFSAGGGGGGGGGAATAKSSESVRSKLIMCSFRFSAGFFGRAAAAKLDPRLLFSRVSPGPFLVSSLFCTEAGIFWGSTL